MAGVGERGTHEKPRRVGPGECWRTWSSPRGEGAQSSDTISRPPHSDGQADTGRQGEGRHLWEGCGRSTEGRKEFSDTVFLKNLLIASFLIKTICGNYSFLDINLCF